MSKGFHPPYPLFDIRPILVDFGHLLSDFGMNRGSIRSVLVDFGHLLSDFGMNRGSFLYIVSSEPALLP